MKPKKILSVLLATVLLLTCISLGAVNVSAATSGITGDCTWSTTWSLTGTALTISGEGAMGNYDGDFAAPWGENITSVTIKDGVTSIGNNAFSWCEKLTEVTIPNSVIRIGVGAFERCTNLTNVSIGESVAIIDDSAFYFCSRLTSVSIPDSVTTIGDRAFQYCYGLTKLIIPDSVSTIGVGAFEDCRNLTSIIIGSGVTFIGNSAFSWCTSLEEVCISDLAAWCGIDFDSYYANPLYFAHNLYLNENLITNLTIPDDVTGIGEYAFHCCDSLTSVTIPDGVTSIGWAAFAYCTNLTSVTIPDSVTTIGGSAFSGCDSLTSATIGNGVTTIENYTFDNCTSLTTITIPSSVTAIGDAFGFCGSLTAIEVDECNASYSSVEGVLFTKDKTTLLRCPEGKVGDYTVPNSTTSIEDFAFRSCDKLTSVVISDSVTCIGLSTFDFCTDLTSVTIGNGVTTIENYAFDNCTSLTSVTIPDSVTTIGRGAFRSCNSLASVHITDLEAWCGIDFGDYDANPLYYAHKLYLNKNPITSLTIPDSITTIERYAFNGYRGLTSVVIKSGVTNIGDDAFYGCTNLTSVTVGDSVTTIGAWAFYGCTNLTSVAIPDSVTTIGALAFYDCTSLTDVWYAGTEEQANNINISGKNETFLNATWHYNCKFATITKQPTTGYAKMGKKVKVTVEAEGDGLTYVWRVKNAGSSKYSASSITSNTYSVTMSDKVKNRRVFCYVYDKYGNMVQSKSVLLREAVSIETQPQNTKVAKGEKAKVTVKASGDGLTYTWYVKNEGATKYTKSSITKATYSVTMTDKVHMRLLYCVVTDKYGNTVKTEKVRLRMK